MLRKLQMANTTITLGIKGYNMTKFILGYATPEANELSKYTTKEEAEFDSEEWCEIEAENLEDAKQLYEDQFSMWRMQSSFFGGR